MCCLLQTAAVSQGGELKDYVEAVPTSVEGHIVDVSSPRAAACSISTSSARCVKARSQIAAASRRPNATRKTIWSAWVRYRRALRSVQRRSVQRCVYNLGFDNHLRLVSD